MSKLIEIKYIAEQLIVQGNLKVVDTAFSENYVAHAGEKIHKGHQFIKQFTKQVKAAIPDIKITKIEILSETANTLTWQRILSGTHKASLKGIPASNQKVKWYEIVVSRFENDKIVEEWLVSDLAFQLMIKLK
jgi:predicted ester cyclase